MIHLPQQDDLEQIGRDLDDIRASLSPEAKARIREKIKTFAVGDVDLGPPPPSREPNPYAPSLLVRLLLVSAVLLAVGVAILALFVFVYMGV